MTFGSMVANATAGGATTLSFSAGGVKSTVFAMIHSPAYGVTYTHGIDLTTGSGRFNDLTVTDDLSVADELTARTLVVEDGLSMFDGGNDYITAGAAYGEFRISGLDFKVRTLGGVEKFTVNDTNGNTAIAGTLAVTGLITGAASATITGQMYSDTILTTAQATIGSYLTVGNASSAVLNLHTDSYIYRTGAGAIRTNSSFTSDGTVYCSAVVPTNAITCPGYSAHNGSYNEFLAAVGNAAVYTRAQKFQVRSSGDAVNFEVSDSTGAVSVQGTQVLSTRYGSAVTDQTSIIACLKHHGLCPP
jgi:hypothetical protein